MITTQRWSQSGQEPQVESVLNNGEPVGFTWAAFDPSDRQAKIVAADRSGARIGFFKNEQLAQAAIIQRTAHVS